jgi:hypothetical protein
VSKAKLITTAVVVEGRTQAEVAASYGFPRAGCPGCWPAIEPRPVAVGRWSIDASRWRPTGGVRGSIVKPTILAVLDHPRDWQAIHRELTSRYATDYEIICESLAAACPAAAGRLTGSA